MNNKPLAALGLTVVILLAACGDDDDTDTSVPGGNDGSVETISPGDTTMTPIDTITTTGG